MNTDSEDLIREVIWEKVRIPIREITQKPILKISIKISKKFLLKYSRILCLFDDDMLLLKPNSLYYYKKLKFDMNIPIRAFPIFKKKSKQNILKGFRIVYKEKSCTIISSNPKELQELREKLSEKLIFTNFDDNYRIGLKSGEGKFCFLFYLECARFPGAHYAGKFFRKDSLKNKHYGFKAVVNEMHILKRLQNHANIVKFYENYEIGETFAFVFEWIAGLSLRSLFYTKFEFSPANIKKIMIGILKGLKHIHENGIMHRDIKLENIMLREGDLHEDNVVILDFGLAQHIDEKDVIFTRCGSPGYVAPEVLLYDPNTEMYQEFCDMFSLGIIFHFLLFKCSPYSKNVNHTEFARRRKNEEDFFEYKYEIYQNADPLAFQLLKSMLKRDPLRRITAEEALNDPYFLESDILENIEERSETFYLKGICEKVPGNSYTLRENYETARNIGNLLNSMLGLSTMRRLNDEIDEPNSD